MKFKLFIIFLANILCVSCIKFKKQSETKDEVFVQSVSNQLLYQIEYLPESEPGYYTLQIKFKSIPELVEFTYGDKTESSINQSEIRIHHLKNGEYQFGDLTVKDENQKIIRRERIEINPPIDLVINGRYELAHDENIKVERLFLKKQSQIFNGPYNLNISAHSIIAEKESLIGNFDNSVYGAGLSAGSIYIQADQLSGSFEFVSQGQHGAKGLNGWDLIVWQNLYLTFEKVTVYHESRYEYCHPQSGNDGGLGGLIQLKVKQSTDAVIEKKVLDSLPGPSGELMTLKVFIGDIKNYQRPILRTDCHKPTNSGQPGAKGRICMKLSENSPNFCEN